MEERIDAPAPVRDAAGERRTYRSAELVFERHYHDYQLALREVQNGGAQRIAEIRERFADAANRAYREWDQAARDAYDRYVSVVQRDPSEGSESDAQEAYREYVRVFEEGQRTAKKAWGEASEAFHRAVQEAQYDVSEAWDAAFRDYIGDVRGSWGDIAVDTVTPGSICAIAQTMIAAAASAQSAEFAGARRPAASFDQEPTREGETR